MHNPLQISVAKKLLTCSQIKLPSNSSFHQIKWFRHMPCGRRQQLIHCRDHTNFHCTYLDLDSSIEAIAVNPYKYTHTYSFGKVHAENLQFQKFLPKARKLKVSVNVNQDNKQPLILQIGQKQFAILSATSDKSQQLSRQDIFSCRSQTKLTLTIGSLLHRYILLKFFAPDFQSINSTHSASLQLQFASLKDYQYALFCINRFKLGVPRKEKVSNSSTAFSNNSTRKDIDNSQKVSFDLESHNKDYYRDFEEVIGSTHQLQKLELNESFQRIQENAEDTKMKIAQITSKKGEKQTNDLKVSQLRNEIKIMMDSNQKMEEQNKSLEGQIAELLELEARKKDLQAQLVLTKRLILQQSARWQPSRQVLYESFGPSQFSNFYTPKVRNPIVWDQ